MRPECFITYYIILCVLYNLTCIESRELDPINFKIKMQKVKEEAWFVLTHLACDKVPCFPMVLLLSL